MADEDDARPAGSDDRRIGLDEAYSVRTPDDSRRLYAKWADTYDAEFIAANDYVYHENVVSVFVAAGGVLGGAVLDVGCGTGIVGVALRSRGARTVDGIDISPEMLEIARGKTTPDGDAVYRALIEADLTKTVDLPDASYSGVVSAGTFTHGHLPPGAIGELLRMASPGARCAIGINENFYSEQGFEAWFDGRASEGVITRPEIVPVEIYDGPTIGPLDHATRGNVAVFTVTR